MILTSSCERRKSVPVECGLRKAGETLVHLHGGVFRLAVGHMVAGQELVVDVQLLSEIGSC